MVRRASRIDENQRRIVAALRRLGASVQHLHATGGGCPDLLVGFGGRNVLLEVKRPPGRKGAPSLTPDQVVWHSRWKGQVDIVDSRESAIRAVLERK